MTRSIILILKCGLRILTSFQQIQHSYGGWKGKGILPREKLDKYFSRAIRLNIIGVRAIVFAPVTKITLESLVVTEQQDHICCQRDGKTAQWVGKAINAIYSYHVIKLVRSFIGMATKPCTLTLIANLSVAVKTGKQLTCPSEMNGYMSCASVRMECF